MGTPGPSLATPLQTAFVAFTCSVLFSDETQNKIDTRYITCDYIVLLIIVALESLPSYQYKTALQVNPIHVISSNLSYQRK